MILDAQNLYLLPKSNSRSNLVLVLDATCLLRAQHVKLVLCTSRRYYVEQNGRTRPAYGALFLSAHAPRTRALRHFLRATVVLFSFHNVE